MEDFIYLIALIAWVVFAFYRKTQKKNEAARDARRKSESQDESGPLTTLEEILLGKEPTPEVQPLPASESYTTDGKSPVLDKTSFEREYNRLGISSIEEMDRPMSLQITKHVDLQDDEILLENNIVEDLKFRMDLRQAVIYSEILNRPYI